MAGVVCVLHPICVHRLRNHATRMHCAGYLCIGWVAATHTWLPSRLRYSQPARGARALVERTCTCPMGRCVACHRCPCTTHPQSGAAVSRAAHAPGTCNAFHPTKHPNALRHGARPQPRVACLPSMRIANNRMPRVGRNASGSGHGRWTTPTTDACNPSGSAPTARPSL